MPWTPADAKRHSKKANSPKKQRMWAHVADSALSRGASEGSAIRQASGVVAHRHAAGGSISPLASLVGNPMKMRSSLPHLGQPMGGAGHARMPHIPLMDTMHNIDQHMAGARAKLPKLRRGGSTRLDEGGRVSGQSTPGSPGVSGAIKDVAAALRDYFIQRPAREIAAERDAHDRAVMEGTYTGPSRPLPPPDGYADGGEVHSSSPGSPGVSGAVRDALAALKDYMISRPKREIQAAREANENAVIDNTYAGPTRQSGKPKEDDYAAGGQVPPLGEQAIRAVRAAVAHLANKDASSAAATLHGSPEAMQHPVVRHAAHALRSGTGLAPATRGLSGVVAQMPPTLGQ